MHMSTSATKPPVIVFCGTEYFRLDRNTGDDRSWRIYSWHHGSTEWRPRPEALIDILHARGALYRERQDSYVEWQIKGFTDSFRACRLDGAWTIDSKEPGGARWYECDAWALGLAFGFYASPPISKAA